MSARDAEYTEYVAARLSSLRRLAAVLCDDWQRADDLVQATLTKLYVHWGRAREASHADAYAGLAGAPVLAAVAVAAVILTVGLPRSGRAPARRSRGRRPRDSSTR
jgi:hypothetical protein